ncbi:hypothetical protein SprV_0401499000 [Sparganum proliferum]
MDDATPPKQLFYRDVNTGACQPGGPKRRYKDTLKDSPKRLQTNPETWEDLAQNRPVGRREVKTGTPIYEADGVATAKVKRTARKCQAPSSHSIATQSHLTCPHCHRTFLARIDPVGQLRTQCVNRPTATTATYTTAPAATSTAITSAPTLTNGVSNPITLLSVNTTSIMSATTTAAKTNTITPTTTSNDRNSPDAPTTINTFTIITPTSNYVGPVPTSPHCDHTLAWSVTCESFVRKLANQCPEHQCTPSP